MNAPLRTGRKRYGPVRILAALLTIVLMSWVIWKQDWRALVVLATTARGLGFLAASIGFAILGQMFASWRWMTLLREHNRAFPFFRAVKLTFISSFASLVLPTTTGGDIVRIVGVDDRDGPARVSVVAIDRIVSLASMLSLLPFAILSLGWKNLLVSSFFVSGKKFLNDLWDEVLRWRKHPLALAAAFVLSLASFAAGWGSAWALCLGLGINVTYQNVVASGVWIYLIGILPISINGLGLQEAGYVYLYGLLGVAAGPAATLGLLVRLVYTIAVLPGGVWLAIDPDLRARINR